jgi:hypothetical protein
MILRINPRIRDRLLRLIFLGSMRSWLLLGAMCATASAEPPQPPPPVSPPVTTPAQSTVAPDEGFLEFLGSDDVGDAAWWEFLKKAPPRGSVPPAPPPQDAKK